MKHLDAISDFSNLISNSFHIKLTGRYYTHHSIANKMYESIFQETTTPNGDLIKITDPFAGDGRLVVWFIEEWSKRNPLSSWDVLLIDIYQDGLELAQKNLEQLKAKNIDIKYTIKLGDSFRLALEFEEQFDFVVTNPPWELLKPDSREIKDFGQKQKEIYISALKQYDHYLTDKYPTAQPKKKFSGWGTNLSRVGAELSYRLCKKNGVCAIVLPASFFADEQSSSIRSKFLLNGKALEISYFPAEAKLFDRADNPSCSLTYKKNMKPSDKTLITVFDKNLNKKSSTHFELSNSIKEDSIIPINLGGNSIRILQKMQEKLPRWGDLEKSREIWAGREIDETGIKKHLTLHNAGLRFIKGAMINRYKTDENSLYYIPEGIYKIPISCEYARIGWRDVSRPNQKRRIIASLIPPKTATGNSLGVVYYKSGNQDSLNALLGVINSLCFEFQLRCYLATGHISLSSLRKVHIPKEESLLASRNLVETVRSALCNNTLEYRLEAIVAHDIYKITKEELVMIMNLFEKLTPYEKKSILMEYEKLGS